ncbi:hypothetical protein DERP_011658 [Dermatophagoides pteronyssinus]|uniref:Uncharacterized protein n=1 Tax=Dermatophagoides pteronyssinus TaxID=6956 RepID=A0ABQ8JWI6_DERPT|nr:hypothetical protein DERP_011658 [Dermatophagoides pteronyssinus]
MKRILAPLAYLGDGNNNGLNELKNEYVELNKPGVGLAKNGDVYVTIGVCNDCANDKLFCVGLFVGSIDGINILLLFCSPVVDVDD